MIGHVGDRIVVESERVAHPGRVGEIEEALGGAAVLFGPLGRRPDEHLPPSGRRREDRAEASAGLKLVQEIARREHRRAVARVPKARRQRRAGSSRSASAAGNRHRDPRVHSRRLLRGSGTTSPSSAMLDESLRLPDRCAREASSSRAPASSQQAEPDRRRARTPLLAKTRRARRADPRAAKPGRWRRDRNQR